MTTRNGDPLREALSKRQTILERLLEGPTTKPTLVSELSYSRSTIDRSINELQDVGCVKQTSPAGSKFVATKAGRLAYQTYQEYREATNRLYSEYSVLNALPEDAPLDNVFLSDASFHSSPRTPDVALNPAIERLDDAEKLTGTAPVIFSDYFETLIGQVQHNDLALELILEEELLSSIQANFQAEFESLSGFDNVEIAVTDESLPYALWIIETYQSTHAGITIYKDGGIKGSIVNSSEDAVEWAWEQYNSHKQSSYRVTVNE